MISKNLIKFIRGLELKKNRKREGLFVAEGPKLVEELTKRFRPHTIVTTEECYPMAESIKHNHPLALLVKVSDEELCKVSFLQHPQHILAVFHIPQTDSYDSEISICKAMASEDQLIIALDGIQDPGNLGTIIRIADWFAIDNIVCSPGTADIYNPKVVQATMGSLTRVKVVYTELEDFFTSLPTGTRIYGTLLDGDNIYDKALSSGGVIVMGNEGNGISSTVRARITDRLLIPNFRNGDGAESLNVAIATAITCSEFRRR